MSVVEVDQNLTMISPKEWTRGTPRFVKRLEASLAKL
jgi:hypothetical protein